MPSENENILEQLHTARQQVAALTTERDGLRGQIAQLTIDRDAARNQLSASPSAKPTVPQPSAAAQQQQQAGAKTPNLTEQCLAVTQGKDQIHRGD